jgi:D-amino-acid dehydrogenase
MRPLFAAANAEHELLLKEAGAEQYLRKNGWLKIYRTAEYYQKAQSDLDIIAKAGIQFQLLDQAGSLALEPNLAPIFANGVFWPTAASISNPLAVTRAYAARFAALGGVVLKGDARSLHRANERWRVDTDEGPVDAPQAVIALGPWSQKVLDPLGLKLPLQVKRGYHLHFKPRGNKGLSRPTLDPEVGYLVAPMEQGLRLTTGAEFADVDAPSTPVQFDRLMPKARELFPLGEQIEQTAWMGARPSFPDSRPVIGRAPGLKDLWLDFGHTHWGLTLGPVSGRLLAEMMTGATPFCDPAPYQAERFL